MDCPTTHHHSLQVHHLDLSSKLPWLKQDEQKQSRNEADKREESIAVTAATEEAGIGGEDGSSELQALDTERDKLSGDISGHSLHSSKLEDSPFQFHSDGMDPSLPPLPPKDYDLGPTDLPPLDLPPRDYPMSPDHVKPLEWTGDLISDDDYYAQMMNNINM